MITKDDAGKVHVNKDEMATRHGAWGGAVGAAAPWVRGHYSDQPGRQGFLTPDYAGRYPAARAELADWLREGRLISREDILEGGVRTFPDVLPKLFTGENIVKLILAVP